MFLLHKCTYLPKCYITLLTELMSYKVYTNYKNIYNNFQKNMLILLLSFQTIISICLCCLAAVVRAQFGGFGFSSFGGFGLDSPLRAARDPRQNPGPVVFPPAPPDNGETSGVVVGASGYGFVPPNSPSK